MAVVRVVAASIAGKDEVAFDEHAIERMDERGITETQVLSTLQAPDMTGLRADPGRLRVRRHYGSHSSIDVVYEEEATRLLVVTVIRIRRI